MALNFPDSPTLNQVYTDSTSGFSYQWNGTVWISYAAASTGNIRILDDISASFNGSSQTFALTSQSIALSPPNPQSVVVNLGGVVQDPSDDYTVSGSNIIFSTAPASGLSFSGVVLGVAVPVGVSTGDAYFRQVYSPVGVQTTFTFVNGYGVGYLDVFQNGVKLIPSTDYTATDGINFSLSTPAQAGDNVEAVGYRVTSVAITNGSVSSLNVSGNAVIAGITTLNSSLTITSGGANITGVVTATSFNGNATTATYATTAGIATYATTAGVATVAQGLTGTPDITVGIATVNTELDVGVGGTVLTAISSTGRIGLGTATPASKLDLFGASTQSIVSIAASDINCSLGNYFTDTINGNKTYTVSNVPASRAYSFTLEVNNTSGTITWFSGVQWPGGTAPTLSTGKTHLFMFLTDDSGTTWRSSSLVNYTT